MSFTRFAIYYVPPDGAFATFGASWLGWDVARGEPARHFDLPGLDNVTVTPRKYGFHGTLKAPFRLADGCSQAGLEHAVGALATQVTPARCTGLQLSTLGNFLALTPFGDMSALCDIATACVTKLDQFRAPPGPAELARRRAADLSPRQDKMLVRWGYPYVMEEFRFHMTLSSKLDPDALAHWQDRAAETLPELPAPFEIGSIALAGERDGGAFELIHRYALTG